MQRERNTGIRVLLTDLKACGGSQNLQKGKQLHAEAAECGHDSNIYVASALVTMYAKCGSIVDAHKVFDSIKQPNVVSYNAIVLGYADNGQANTALDLFKRMKAEGVEPTRVTFLAALKACTSLEDSRGKCGDRGKEIHDMIRKHGCDSDVSVQNALIHMYTKCGCIADAHQVFESMSHPDVISWTALVLGYADNGQGLISLDLFKRMKSEGPAPDSVTMVAALKAYSSLSLEESGVGKCKSWGKEIHNLAVENGLDSDVHVQSTLIDMYAKCGSMLDARHVFNSMKHPAVVSYNALILGYADNGQGHSALEMFRKMSRAGPAPNYVTFVAVLKACGALGALELGRRIHLEIASANLVLVNSLVDFYAKCSSMVEARSVFDLHAETRDLVTWNALISGFSSCGDHASVFQLLEEMQGAGFRPTSVTFLSVLLCCCHAGLVEKGKECFDAMEAKHGVAATVKHCTCMADTFARANKLDDAMALLQRMPYSPNDVTWTTVLCACHKRKNVEVGRLAFQSLMNLDERNAAAHVLMGQIYRSRGMLQEQELVMGMRKPFRARRMQDETCWTNEEGEVHAFSEASLRA